ncbi:hypothetical protein M501DRAFT_1028458 [Patellaria atrata CBS 101060]|uniref:Mid2 domain-containing protein n=1 Tax=Patellaria atrata CBS 101060 TaxID=1346257 RepID=A0A9P4SJE3_9PEZI|nr:hypothetical protein M501DRAFT_1028458 [Patellaria atrata CBS 101060]
MSASTSQMESAKRKRAMETPSYIRLIALLSLISFTTSTLLDDLELQINLNFDNATAIQNLVAEYGPQLYPSAQSTSTIKAQIQPTIRPGSSPLPPSVLEKRQGDCDSNGIRTCSGGGTCTGCGICCANGNIDYCCQATGFICCPASSSGCCSEFEFCRSTGCVSPEVTSTITSTFWSSEYDYHTSFDTEFITQTITQTEYSTRMVTASDVDTATVVVDRTTTLEERRAKRTAAARAKPRAHATLNQLPLTQSIYAPIRTKTQSDPAIVTLLTSPNLDALSEKLSRIGLLVKRQNTNTIYETVTATATTTIDTTIVSTLTSTDTLTRTVQEQRVATTFVDADTTVTSTRMVTITRGAENTDAPDPTRTGDSADSTGTDPSDPTSTSSKGGDDGLSTGAAVGIGLGTAAAVALILGLLFFFWRRSKKNKQAQGPVGASGPGMGMNPALHHGYPQQPYYDHGPEVYTQHQGMGTPMNTSPPPMMQAPYGRPTSPVEMQGNWQPYNPGMQYELPPNTYRDDPLKAHESVRR